MVARGAISGDEGPCRSFVVWCQDYVPDFVFPRECLFEFLQEFELGR